jgi:hypothetical protein
MSTSDELKYIYDTDQADRGTGYWMIDPERDRIRLQRVKVLYRAGQITDPSDQYAAALVYQHGSCADEFQVAYELSTAAAMGYPLPANYRWRLSPTRRMIAGSSHWGSRRPMARSSSHCPSSARVRSHNS